jgi:hypothetical protein
MKHLSLVQLSLLVVLAFSACSEITEDPASSLGNPFLDDWNDNNKADTLYYNPDGIEVEVDIEGDVEASAYNLYEGPAELGQYAVTNLRKSGQFYLESLAEDATSEERVEWQIGEDWFTTAQVKTMPDPELRHFRIRGVNAVLLKDWAGDAYEGEVFTAVVPIRPFSVMDEAGDSCADEDDHISLSQSVYWYLWYPSKYSCELETQELQVTISKLFPFDHPTYPEYDLLVNDSKITTVILFGKISDNLDEWDPGVRNLEIMADWLLGADFEEEDVSLGRRFSKTINEIVMEIDLYSPYEFSGLGDYANFPNFQKAISEHEIVAYDGHSMLGSSDFWSRPDYPDFYQIYLYGGCLGYEYYVRPIVQGKNGWPMVDIVSSVIEVSADANYYAGAFLGKLMQALDNDYNVTWNQILQSIRRRVGDSTFGVSGVRENCFTPIGSRCDPNQPEIKTYSNDDSLPIPENDSTGITSTIQVPDSFVIKELRIKLDINHSYVSDLQITLEHEGLTTMIWDGQGDDGQDNSLPAILAMDDFDNMDAGGEWILKIVDIVNFDQGSLDGWILEMISQ